MPHKSGYGQLKGSKAKRSPAAGKALTAAASRIGAYHAGKNYAAKAIPQVAPTATPRPKATPSKAPSVLDRLNQLSKGFK